MNANGQFGTATDLFLGTMLECSELYEVVSLPIWDYRIECGGGEESKLTLRST